jgi:hypothetical protein
MTEERDMTEEGRPDSPASKTDKKTRTRGDVVD